MWSVHDGDQLVGFVMISDNIEDLGDDMLGPYYLWRLLVDAQFQGRGYGAATLDAVVEYLRTRPGADVLLDELRSRARVRPNPSTSTTASSPPARSSGTRWSFAWTSAQDPRA